MYVRITLYKSGFDPGNCFVGESKQARESALATLPNLVLPISGYNPRRPFRISGNFLEYDRIYDYMKYELGTTADLSDAQIRYYFVSAFQYVNDTETDIIIIDDLTGTLWHDLKFSNLVFDRYTYKEADISTANLINDYNVSKYLVGDLFDVTIPVLLNSGGSAKYGLAGGFIVIVSLMNNAQYTEAGTSYPFNIDLLPFIYNKITGEIIDHAFYVGSQQIQSVTSLSKYFYQTTTGFKFIDDFVFTFALPNLSFTYVNESAKIVRIDFFSEMVTRAVERANFGLTLNLVSTSLQSLKKYLGLADSNNPYIRDNKITARSPFYKTRFQANNKYIDIDPIMWQSIDFGVVHSFVPPFNVSVGPLPLTTGEYMSFTPYSTFFAYTDTYTEYLRNNYNSVVTGLETQQYIAKAQREVQNDYSLQKWGINALTGSIGVVANAAAGDYGKALGGGAQILNQLGQTILSNAEKDRLLEIQQAKERTMLNLQMQDLKNTPDQISINSSLFNYVISRSYFKIYYLEAMELGYYQETFKRFGVKLTKFTPDNAALRSHRYYDYIRIISAEFAEDSIKLNQTEAFSLKQELQAGVRLWYDLAHYKDYTIRNSEISS